MAGKQSQANKNFWYAYALWQQKVAQALARRRAEALAKQRQASLASKPPKPTNPVLALLAKLIPTAQKVVKLVTIGMAVASLLMMAGSVVQDGAEGGVYPQGGVGLAGGGGGFEEACGAFYVDGTMDTLRCSVGAAIQTVARRTQELIRQNGQRIASLIEQYGPYAIRLRRNVVEYGNTSIVTQTNADVLDPILDEILADNALTADEIAILIELGLWEEFLNRTDGLIPNVMYSEEDNDWILQQVDSETLDTSSDHWWQHKSECWSDITGLDAREIRDGKHHNRLLDVVKDIMDRPDSVFFDDASKNYVFTGQSNNVILYLVIRPGLNRLVQILFFRNDGTQHPCSE